jgi:hypothetical protein
MRGRQAARGRRREEYSRGGEAPVRGAAGMQVQHYAPPRADAEELRAEAACGRGELAADDARLDVLALVRPRVPARPTCCRREARLCGP